MVTKTVLIAIAGVSIMLFAGCGSTGLYLLNSSVKVGKSQPVERDIAYGSEVWQTLDVYPQQRTEGPAPVIVFLYGGGWDSGKKEQYYFAANAFLKRGYTVVVPDYVKFPEGKFPAFVEDGALSIAWVKQNIGRYHGDAGNIFLVGHSAGAHTGALLMTDDRYLQRVGLSKTQIRAFAGMAGPYGFTPKEPKYIEIFSPPENFPKMKAMNFVDGSESPMLLMHGLADDTVGVLNKDTLVDTLQQAGVTVGDIEYEDVSHVGILLKLHPLFASKINAADDIDEFFRPLRRQVDQASKPTATPPDD